MDTKGSANQRLTDSQDILRVLHALVLNKSLITLTLPGSRLMAASMALKVEANGGHWLLDMPQDEAFNRKLSTKRKLLVRAAYGGVQVSCECDYLSRLIYEQSLALNCTLPILVWHRQRRAAYRVNLGHLQRPSIELHSEQRQAVIEGKVYDLSADGLGVVFSRLIQPPIEPGEIFSCPRLHPDLPEQHWQLRAQHPHYDRLADQYRCGFSFTGLSAGDAKKINQWVLAAQRAQRRLRPA